MIPAPRQLGFTHRLGGAEETTSGSTQRSQRQSHMSPQFGNGCVQWPDQGTVRGLELV